MLHEFLARLKPRGTRVLGFLLARELEECGKDIMAVFGITDFYRDYEDTWEWVEGISRDSIAVNVSRPHDWKTGDYHIPVIVHVRAPLSHLTDEAFSQYAKRLATALHTEVWFGRKTTQERGERYYDFEIDERFTPAA